MAMALGKLTVGTCRDVLLVRTRLHLNHIYRNERLARELAAYTGSLRGVSFSQANPLTGSLLITFDKSMINEAEIKKYIYRFIICSDVKIKTAKLNNYCAAEEYESPSVNKAPSPDKHAVYKNSGYNYHALDPLQLIKAAGSDMTLGLTVTDAEKKLKELGLNTISENKRKSIIAKFMDNLGDFSSRLLTAVGITSLLLGQLADGIVILGIVTLQTILCTIQQQKAEKSLCSLREMVVQNARIIRDGKMSVINSKYLVPGDIILVEAGEKVPADARIIECNDLRISEASLTGESTPVCKCCDICDPDTEIAGRKNMIFMGTNILSGRGKALVVETGLNTQVGRIAHLLKSIETEPAPIENKIRNFTNQLTKVSFASCIGIGLLGLTKGGSIPAALAFGVSFAIGAIPESLPTLVTASMALSVQRMATKNAIVRRLPAVETLGCANVICCDKTGTLTMNEMTVKKVFVDNSMYEFSGSGYKPEGKVSLLTGNAASDKALQKLLTAAVLCNNSKLESCDGKWEIQGDPTEAALITAACKNKINAEEIQNKYSRINEIPFDSSRRFMTVMVNDGESTYAFCKGSLSKIMDKCKLVYENGEERLFTSTDRERLRKLEQEFGTQALRILAFAYKNIYKTNETIDSNFVFLGVAAMEDPPREGVKEAIEKCRSSGIKVVMITGDNKNTAAAIGSELGLLSDGLIISGTELDRMSDEELCSKINQVQIFARTSPEQKYRIVKAFRKMGNVVAMTGDGVNDGPAIKEADIGIAMGKKGTDVARDSADIILMDDDFSTIVAAIEEGRAVTQKIKNSIKYLLSGSLGETAAILLAIMCTGSPALLSIQILWINIISETIMGSSFSFEMLSKEIMKVPPEGKDTPIFDKALKRYILRRGSGIGFLTFSVFSGALLSGTGISKARTSALSTLVLSQLLNVYDCRSSSCSARNRYMNLAAAASATLLAGIIYIPALSSFFGTVALNPANLAVICAAAGMSRNNSIY